MAYRTVHGTFASFDTGSEHELTITALTLAGAVDFTRLVWPQARSLARGRPVHFSPELWSHTTEAVQQRLSPLGVTPRRRVQPQTGARNPKVLTESRRMPPTGEPAISAPKPTAVSNATLCVQLNRTGRELVGRQPARLLVRPLDLTLPLSLTDGYAEFAIHVDAQKCTEGTLLLELFVRSALGPQQVYARASTASAYQCIGACLVDAREERTPIVLPTNERPEDYVLGEACISRCSHEVQALLSGGPTFDDLDPVLDLYNKREREVEAHYDVADAPTVGVMPRPIHTPLSAAFAAEAGRSLSETSLPRFFWLQTLRYVPWHSLDATRKENIVARLLVLGFEEASNPRDPADVLAHALMALPRATGYVEDSFGDQLLLLFQYPVAHGDCEDIALLLMFLGEMFMHSDTAKVCALMQKIAPKTDQRLVRETMALMPSRYRVVYVNNCADMQQTQAHDMCLLMPTVLLTYLLRDPKTRGKAPDCGPALSLESMDDMQTRPDDRVADSTLKEAVDSKSYLNYCTLATLEGQWLLVDTNKKGKNAVVGLPPKWLFDMDEQARSHLEAIRTDPLFTWEEMCSSECAQQLLRGPFGAQAYAWRLSDLTKPTHITDAHELVPV